MLRRDVYQAVNKALNECGLAKLPATEIYDGSMDDAFIYDEKMCYYFSETIRNMGRNCLRDGGILADVNSPDYDTLKGVISALDRSYPYELRWVLHNSLYGLIELDGGAMDRERERTSHLLGIHPVGPSIPAVEEDSYRAKEVNKGISSEHLELTRFVPPEKGRFSYSTCRNIVGYMEDWGSSLDPEISVLMQMGGYEGDDHNVFYNVRLGYGTGALNEIIGALGFTIYLGEPRVGYLQSFTKAGYRRIGYVQEAISALVEALLGRTVYVNASDQKFGEYKAEELDLTDLKLEVTDSNTELRKAVQDVGFRYDGVVYHKPRFYDDPVSEVHLYTLDLYAVRRERRKKLEESSGNPDDDGIQREPTEGADDLC